MTTVVRLQFAAGGVSMAVQAPTVRVTEEDNG
jgi:hypothetical protein